MIEDACQSHLASGGAARLGTWGDTGCFSFQASKNLNCGDGGAILTNATSWPNSAMRSTTNAAPAGPPAARLRYRAAAAAISA